MHLKTFCLQNGCDVCKAFLQSLCKKVFTPVLSVLPCFAFALMYRPWLGQLSPLPAANDAPDYSHRRQPIITAICMTSGGIVVVTCGVVRRGAKPQTCRLAPHHETYWSRIRRWIVPDFHILMVSAVKICKQCLQTASASWSPDLLPGLRRWTQLDFPQTFFPLWRNVTNRSMNMPNSEVVSLHVRCVY